MSQEKNTIRKKMKKADFVLIGFIFILAAGILIWTKIRSGGTGDRAIITVAGKEYAELLLSKDIEFIIKGENGGKNILAIENGYAKMIDANCPDKKCVHQGKINAQGQTIICLPNQVLISVKGENISDLDGVAN